MDSKNYVLIPQNLEFLNQRNPRTFDEVVSEQQLQSQINTYLLNV